MTLNMLVTSFLQQSSIEKRKKTRRLTNQAAILANVNSICKAQKVPNWDQVIQDILDAGVESAGLSMALGKSKSWADKYLRNSTKKMDYKIGAALLEVHKEYVK